MNTHRVLVFTLAGAIAACGSATVDDQNPMPPSASQPPPAGDVPNGTAASALAIPKGKGLATLAVSSAVLVPAFDPGRAKYRVSVEVMAGKPFTVTATPENPLAEITVKGKKLTPGLPSEPIYASEAFNPIDIVVKQPGFTATYTLLAAAAQDAYVKASNTKPDQYFSNDLAISGDTLVVGAWGDASAANQIDGDGNDTSAPHAGAAHVYRRQPDGTWQHEAYLKALNNRAEAYYGITVAVDNDTIVVGAQDESSGANVVDGDYTDTSAPGAGAAYVYRRYPCPPSSGGSSGSSGSSGGTVCQPWVLEGYLKASNARAGAGFGTSVSIKGDAIAVGSWTESSASTGVNGNQADTNAPESGAAYVFRRTGTTWAQEAYLKPSNTRSLARFGNSIAIDGDTVAVGSLLESSNATGVNGNQNDASAPGTGSAYVFTRTAGAWSQQAYLTAINTSTSANVTGGFSIAIALSGDNLAVGGYVEASASTGTNGNPGDTTALNAGAVYIYHRAAGTWSHEAYLKPPNTRSLALFGYSLAMEGDMLVVGSCNESSNATGIDGTLSDTSAPMAGAAYLFARDGGLWTKNAYLKASNTRPEALFGYAVGVSGDRIAVGSRIESSAATNVGGNQANTGAPHAGAVYVFR